jgi:hypothetical protein
MTNKKPRNPIYFLAGFFCFSALGYLTNNYIPNSIYLVIIFIFLLCLSVFFILLFLLNSFRQPALITLGLSGILLLRYLGLRQPVITLMLIFFLITVEWYLKDS